MTLPCTVIVIAHQDTPVLWRSLASVGWAESVFVLDAGSTIPLEHWKRSGVSQVYPVNSPISDFAEVRNFGLKQVSTPWCFFLDSDEVVDLLSDSAVRSLESMLGNAETAGLSITRNDVFLGEKLSYGEAGKKSLVRFMRPQSVHWIGAAHETPVISGNIQQSTLEISHYSHESISSFLVDVSRYAKIVAGERSLTQTSNLLQMLVYPPFKLAYDLLILGAVLDGWRGIIYSYCMALHSLLVRIYWYEAHTDVVSQKTTMGAR